MILFTPFPLAVITPAAPEAKTQVNILSYILEVVTVVVPLIAKVSLIIEPPAFLPVTATFCTSNAFVLTNLIVAADEGSVKVALIELLISPPARLVSLVGLFEAIYITKSLFDMLTSTPSLCNSPF